jgi:hypothetical protein
VLNSSWILFVYTASEYNGNLTICPAGELKWISRDEVLYLDLPGFIRELIPFPDSRIFFEGTMKHDNSGKLIEKILKVNQEHENRN